MRARRNVIVVLGALVLGAGAAAAAAAEPEGAALGEADLKRSGLLERPGERLVRSIEASEKVERLEAAYSDLAERAEIAGVSAPGDPLNDEDVTLSRLEREVRSLREKLEQAEDASTVAGVPRDTLEAIALCESGGDPAAVSSDGTYRGKYQFDHGTWASVGGSGDPAAAPEAEQDYRAALLYQRSGSSPWPVCG